MIISRTPFRVSFFGGGTDYPEWYLKEGGAVLSTAIDKYCYLTCRYLPPFFSVKHRVVWSHIETVNSISEILHPAVREGLRFLGFDDSTGLEIHHQGDLPARSGIGSSSSFVVGLINALTALRGTFLSSHQLALKAIQLEQEVLRENVGSQDQVATAYGGFNICRFATDGSISVEPVDIPKSRIQELESHLALLYTGSSRLASEVAANVTINLHNQANALKCMLRMVNEGVNILREGTILDDFGELLHQGWMLKKSLAKEVSNSNVDAIYQTARDHGAIGGKLIGAGGAGFMLLFVPPEKQQQVRQALSHNLWVPFRFEPSGSTIVYSSEDVRSEEVQYLSRQPTNQEILADRQAAHPSCS